jgi:hypothetical protein
MIQLELPSKFVRFIIEAVEYRIASYERGIADPDVHEDDRADMGNDKALLQCAAEYLREKHQKHVESL